MIHNRTTMERKSDREVVVTRTFDAPARIVFEAWSKADLFKRWWIPKSAPIKLISCEMDVRVGGKYRLVFAIDESKQLVFFGTYLEVTPPSRLSWTNEEEHGGGAITTVTFEEKGGQTVVTLSELHPSKEALDASGALDSIPETFDQLDELLVTLVASARRS